LFRGEQWVLEAPYFNWEEKSFVREAQLHLEQKSWSLFSHRFLLTVLQMWRSVVAYLYRILEIQGGSNMTGTNCDLFTHK
jgi:hypothetical protein